MTMSDNHLEKKYFALLEVHAKLEAGLEHGTITDLQHVRALISPKAFRPQPTRGSAPTNPNTLDVTGKL